MGTEYCQRCKVESRDLRTLWMACLYDMSELGLPFQLFAIADETSRKFFTLQVCKRCRADWLIAIREWFHDKPEPEEEGLEAGVIYRRELGTARKVTTEPARDAGTTT